MQPSAWTMSGESHIRMLLELEECMVWLILLKLLKENGCSIYNFLDGVLVIYPKCAY